MEEAAAVGEGRSWHTQPLMLASCLTVFLFNLGVSLADSALICVTLTSGVFGHVEELNSFGCQSR